MSGILACVDESSYARSVCDHAAWFAGRLEAPVQVLHAEETASGAQLQADAIIREALEALKDEGVENCQGQALRGSLETAVAAAAPQMVVMGKRGGDSDSERRPLGAHVASMLETVDAPVCLASKIFLPVSRALAVLDANMDHRAAVDFVSTHRGLRDLDIDLIVAASEEQDAAPKIAWARETLTPREAAVFGVAAESLLSAVEDYTKSRACDLIIVSRAVLSAKASADIADIEARGIWNWRTPILVC